MDLDADAAGVTVTAERVLRASLAGTYFRVAIAPSEDADGHPVA